MRAEGVIRGGERNKGEETSKLLLKRKVGKGTSSQRK